MPIRIKKDPDGGSGKKDNYPGKREPRPGGGGNNPIVYLIPMVMKLFGKNPKLLIVIAVIAAAIYFFKGGCNTGGISEMAEKALATGLSFDAQKYDATDIFEPLADNVRNPLPESVSLLEYAPPRLNQGKQGSCVGWASAYAARSILHSRESGQNPNSTAFSPSFLYNQIALKNCQGSYLPDAMKTMKNVGALPLSEFGYDESTCSISPDQGDKMQAQKFTIDGFNRLTKGDDAKAVDMLAIKQNLAQGAPVVIGMMVGGSFMNAMMGEKIWLPTKSDYDAAGFGGHAMCVIGYDDYFEGGAFQIMNSWGSDWGDKGVGWVRYRDFEYFTREAYGLYPMGDANAPTETVNKVEFGLVLSNGGNTVSFQRSGEMEFTSIQALKTNDEFKIEVTNNLPCYIYVFGQETDGSSYTLFPYTKKHSPYCGITGTRLFPNDHSLYPDDQGNMDYMAVVISAQPVDYNQLNSAISNASGGSYSDKLRSALGNSFVSPRSVNDGQRVEVSLDLGDNGIYGTVLGISKN